jgi:hypothetical protein
MNPENSFAEIGNLEVIFLVSIREDICIEGYFPDSELILLYSFVEVVINKFI